MEELGSPNLDCVSTDLRFPCFGASTHLVLVVTIIPGTILLPVGLLITGWTAQNRVFWLVPDVVSGMNCILGDDAEELLQGIALVGAGTIVAFQSVQAYVIDSFTLHAASGAVQSRLRWLPLLTPSWLSQLLRPLRSCALWPASVSRCSLLQCTMHWVTAKETLFLPLWPSL
jgi:hypothetical protein